MPDWPHSPLHRLGEAGAYMVTAATYQHELLMLEEKRLTFMHDMLLKFARKLGWQLQAWAVLPNHYHFVATSETSGNLRSFTKRLHSLASRFFNRADQTPGRQAFFQYWESSITYERSDLARLHYVHENPVHHGLVKDARQWPWCSAAWFERTADAAFYKTVNSFPIDKIKVFDIECDL